MKKRFPTLSHLCEAGIVTENEQKIIESVDEKCIQHPKYWMSLVWAGAIVTRAKKEGRIKDDFAFRTIIKEINKFRSGCGGLLDYDWISIPLVYTQVNTEILPTVLSGRCRWSRWPSTPTLLLVSLVDNTSYQPSTKWKETPTSQ